MKKAAARLRKRIKGLITDAHWQIAHLLVTRYDQILIPVFETQKMVKKLQSKTARQMMTWSHYSFRMKLIFKAREYDSQVIVCNEAYTSKTCGNCGKLNEKLGGKKLFKCSCGYTSGRDMNGARNIMLRALRDTAFSDPIERCKVSKS